MKYSIRRIDINIGRAIRVLEIDLSRLEKHTQNIDKLKRLGDKTGLFDEQANAWRTVQQLIANIQQLEQLKLQVIEEDQNKFDDRTQPIRDRAAQIRAQFLQAVNHHENAHNAFVSTGVEHEEQTELAGFGTIKPVEQIDTHTLLKEDKENERKWNELENSILELNEIMGHLSSLVQTQGETVKTVQENIDTVDENVDMGAQNIAKAAKYSTFAYPVTGALVGTAVGGTVGFMAGLKLGIVAAGGGLAGYSAGQLWRWFTNRQIDSDEVTRLADRKND